MCAKKLAPPKNAQNNGDGRTSPQRHLSGFEREDSVLYEISGSSDGVGASAVTVFAVYECRMEKLNRPNEREPENFWNGRCARSRECRARYRRDCAQARPRRRARFHETESPRASQ